MTQPNFWVIGAQKCGTTALYDALCQHSGIYMNLVATIFGKGRHEKEIAVDGQAEERVFALAHTERQ